MNSAITETTDGNGIGKNSPATRSVWGIGLAVPILALALRDSLAPWVWMWVMALALFVAAKCITVSRCLVSNGNIHPGRLLAYCLLWPGMDIAPFCTRSSAIEVTICEWVFATAKTVFGALLVWGAVPRLSLHHPLLSGWTGMIGLVFILHFGFFHLLSLLCRALGFNTRPIMSSPGTATSLSRFWGSSWNKAFSDLVHEQLFKPLAKPLGARRALFTVFLVSGLLHELVISLPAR